MARIGLLPAPEPAAAAAAAASSGAEPPEIGSSAAASLLSLPPSLLAFLDDHLLPLIHTASPPLLAQVLAVLQHHGCLPALGPSVHGAVQQRLASPNFLSRLEGLGDAEGERAVRALSAAGFPMPAVVAPVEPSPPPGALPDELAPSVMQPGGGSAAASQSSAALMQVNSDILLALFSHLALPVREGGFAFIPTGLCGGCTR